MKDGDTRISNWQDIALSLLDRKDDDVLSIEQLRSFLIEGIKIAKTANGGILSD